MQHEKKMQYTPMMQQYLAIKEDYADAIVFFRLGDFYEMFFDDAIIASKVLEIALTSRDAGSKVPMCGIPYHAALPYIQKLIEKGFKIAIAEQTTEPGKGLVKREVIRLITPGTVFEENILDASRNNYIASLLFNDVGYLLTYVDVSTGESYTLEGLTKEETMDQVITLKIRELVVRQHFDTALLEYFKGQGVLVTEFQQINMYQSVILDSLSTSQKQGARHLLSYLEQTQKQDLRHIKPFEIESHQHMMRLDYKVKRHLEIFDSLVGKKEMTLLHQLDHTKTSMGARYLRYVMNRPLRDRESIENRYDAIDAFMTFDEKYALQDALQYVYDINRIVGRLGFQSVTPKDLSQLSDTLSQMPLVIALLKTSSHPKITSYAESLDPHDDLLQYLKKAIVEQPPLVLKDGGIIKEGFNQTLDELRSIKDHGESWLASFEEEEKERTGIKNLKVGYNRIFGYFIEVSKANSQLVDDSFGYERKQTLVNSERYSSPRLKEKEDALLHAKERALALEYDLFKEVREYAQTFTHSLQQLSKHIAEIDVFLSLADVASKNHYIRPIHNANFDVSIQKGRHPVVEQYTTFIKNDIDMKKNEVFIITGPNMSGKSTYMRMYAVMVYMSQIGSFVPADYANMPIYDALFTRIGSSDDISGGKSTFMVEMVESNEALTYATAESLILFDEIGRGTATYDGMALAQGMIEYIHDTIGAQTFFSTHYHELTALEEHLAHVTNLCVKAVEEKNTMVFLHTVEKGKSDRSYGLQVASLAHLPEKLLRRSKQILDVLEQKKVAHIDLFNYQVSEDKVASLSLEEEKVLTEIKTVDINQMTPMDALYLVSHLQKLLHKGDKDGHH